MKRTLAIAALLIANAAPAHADVYVAVDAQGNAVGGAIVCDAATCGEGSLYSQLTLQPGQRYVLQGTGQAGIGNNNPNTQVKVDLQTNDWSVTRTNEQQQVVSVQTFNPYKPEPAPTVAPRIETTTVVTDTATVIDSATAILDTATVTSILGGFDWSAFLEMFKSWFTFWFSAWGRL